MKTCFDCKYSLMCYARNNLTELAESITQPITNYNTKDTENLLTYLSGVAEYCHNYEDDK